MSLMYNAKNNGLRKEPCGTPQPMPFSSDSTPMSTHDVPSIVQSDDLDLALKCCKFLRAFKKESVSSDVPFSMYTARDAEQAKSAPITFYQTLALFHLDRSEIIHPCRGKRALVWGDTICRQIGHPLFEQSDQSVDSMTHKTCRQTEVAWITQ